MLESDGRISDGRIDDAGAAPAANRVGAGTHRPRPRPCASVTPAAERSAGAGASWQQLGHELRTPLHAILGNVELLLDGSAGPLSAEARACLGDVQNAGRQLLREIGSTLLLLQAVAAPEAPCDAAVDLVDRLRQALDARAGGRVGLELAPPDARFVVRGDRFWLETLATALADALTDATRGDGGGTVVLTMAPEAGPDDIGVQVGRTPAASAALSPVPLTLIDAIIRLHDGRMWTTEQGGVCLCWPSARATASFT